jgi:transcriptional regulator with XRE-family HTH domain
MGKDEIRRQELSDFLKTRRARVLPAQVELITPQRRRTPGLRREEVALLAGVSSTWYTWLEQGRPVKPSTQLLERLSEIFKLSSTERIQLYQLACGRPPLQQNASQEQISPVMRRLVDSMGKMPAMIIGRRWDILLANDAMRAVMFDFERLPANQRNLLHFYFTHPAPRKFVNWLGRAKQLLARFRVDYGRHAGEAEFVELVEHLKSVSAEFAEWWRVQEVGPPSEGHVEYMHGAVRGDHITLSMAENPDLRMIVIIPDNGSIIEVESLMNQGGLIDSRKVGLKSVSGKTRQESNGAAISRKSKIRRQQISGFELPAVSDMRSDP